MLEKYLTVIKEFLKTEVTKAQAKGLVIGLSGGIDSAVTALLIKAVFPKNHLCLIMPCASNPLDQQLAEKLAQKHQLNYQIVDLTSTYEVLTKTISSTNASSTNKKIVFANIKARLRMTTLYAFAQTYSYLVCGTDNADEWYTGYFTKYGDGGVDILPIIRLLKRDVFAVGKILGVIPEIINRPPSASLWDGQTDEAEMSFTYEDLDNYLLGKFENINAKVMAKIVSMHKKSAHKREKIPQPPEYKRLGF